MKKFTRESFCGILVLALTILGIVLFALNFSTGYYTFGQMNSGLVLTTALAAAVIECFALFCLKKYETKLWPKLLTFVVTALLAFAALTLVGDRVEGIGNCIITDYDSGHGGEEAIYMSLGAVLAWLAAMIFNIIGSFGKNEPMKASGKGILGCAAALVLLGILIPSLLLGGLFAPKAAQSGTGASAGNPAAASTYSIKLSGAEGNVDKVQDYQFQCGNLSGLMNYDTRLTLDLALTLNPDGTYALFSDAYCIEAGKRSVIGDDTGLGMVSVMNAEGTYTVNEDGTVTTSPASHAVFELALDTYSSQMRGPASYKLGDKEMADGKYDSAEYPAVLDSVPETVWTLDSGAIAAYGKPSLVPAGTYSIKLSGAEGNVDKVQDYQFQCGNLSGLMNYDTRLTLDLALTLNPDGTYALFSDAYCIEAGKRSVIGDDTGLGMVSVMNAEGTYTVNEDGTVTTSPASHAVFELALDTYSSQMRGPASYKLGDQEMADGKYDSAEYPVILESVPKTIWTLNSDKTIEAYVSAAPAEEAPAEEAAEAPAVEGVTIPSDDGGTEMTFNSDGTYRFWFGSYSIEDLGTYTYENGVLTLTDVNGKKSSGEGDPIKLHYTYSGSDQLTGDYTIPADSFHFGAEEPAPAEDSAAPAEKAGITAISDDHGTTLTLFNDGSYRFWFEPYSVEDLGSWQIADGVLTVTDKNGKETAAEGNPYRLHYTYSDSDQLTGDYTISADIFPFPVSGVSVPSDDTGTTITFFADGSYLFSFGSHSIVDLGTYTFENGVLTVTDVNGKESSGEGDPIKLHYTYSGSDQLTGDYTIPANSFLFD